MTPEFLQLKKHRLAWDENTLIMGILNLTPDSFSGDGILGNEKQARDRALFQVEKMLSDGADIIDLGGESTRPGAEPVSVEEELARVTVIIESIVNRFDVPISIDTYKSEVAATALD